MEIIIFFLRNYNPCNANINEKGIITKYESFEKTDCELSLSYPSSHCTKRLDPPPKKKKISAI